MTLQIYTDRRRFLTARKLFDEALAAYDWPFADSPEGSDQAWRNILGVACLLDAFAVTDRIPYLSRSAWAIDKALAVRSDKLQIRDERRDECPPAWVTAKEDPPTALPVEAGLVAANFARCAWAAERDPRLRRRRVWRRRIKRYYEAALETVQWIDRAWTETDGAGYHSCVTREAGSLPMNYITSAVTPHVWLLLLTGGEQYREKVERVVRHWRNATWDDGSIWKYAPDQHPEQINYAAVVWNFLIDAHCAGCGPGLDTMRTQANRLVSCIRFDGHENFLGFCERLDGTHRTLKYGSRGGVGHSLAYNSFRLGLFDDRIPSVVETWQPTDPVQVMCWASALMLTSRPMAEYTPSRTFQGLN